MAKKITLDFTKVEERAGWNTKEIPEGIHEFKVEMIDYKDANDGTTMWTYGLRPTNPKYKTRLFPYYCKHQENQLFKIRDLFVAAGIQVPKKRLQLDPEAPLGKIVAAEVSDASGQYAGRSELGGIYDRSIIDEDDQVADDDDELEDDDDELEDDDDELEDDEDEEGDERAEELEAMTLAQLRKEAKGLGIATAGLDKEDLIEAILEAEEEAEEDDEEEEEEPAPRKRPAARKPAAKTPAKPARRTVKRR